MIAWGAFILVALVSIGSAAALVTLFALGLRLLAFDRRRVEIRICACACFTVDALGAIYAVLLLIPSLHMA